MYMICTRLHQVTISTAHTSSNGSHFFQAGFLDHTMSVKLGTVCFYMLCSLLNILAHHLWVQFLKSTLLFFLHAFVSGRLLKDQRHKTAPSNQSRCLTRECLWTARCLAFSGTWSLLSWQLQEESSSTPVSVTVSVRTLTTNSVSQRTTGRTGQTEVHLRRCLAVSAWQQTEGRGCEGSDTAGHLQEALGEAGHTSPQPEGGSDRTTGYKTPVLGSPGIRFWRLGWGFGGATCTCADLCRGQSGLPVPIHGAAGHWVLTMPGG